MRESGSRILVLNPQYRTQTQAGVHPCLAEAKFSGFMTNEFASTLDLKEGKGREESWMRIANCGGARLRGLTSGFGIWLYGMLGLTRAASPASTATSNGENEKYFKVR